MSLEFRFKGC